MLCYNEELSLQPEISEFEPPFPFMEFRRLSDAIINNIFSCLR